MSISRKNFLSLTGLGITSGLFKSFDGNLINNSTLIKPKRIKKGATLGLVAPASPIYNPDQFDTMVSNLEKLGYKLKLGKHVKDSNGYLAGKDVDRAQDLIDMFSDEEVEAILCVRGGWGCNRILPFIDFNVIKSNPKPLIGFSDITSLHMAINKKTGLVTFHGPVGKSDWNEFTLNSWDEVLINAKNAEFHIPDDQEDSFVIHSGVASGKLLGGNLTVLTSLIGSDYLPDFDGAILFLEDIGEDVYRVDRMLTQLKLSGILSKINGLVFGKCTDCSGGENSLTLKEVFDDHISLLDIPAFYGAMISHQEKNITLPVGIQATINANDKSIRLLEPGVQ
tara:strand:+ start:20748 stop:21761 length:1014 start_codon:yes stop_codon:yes gene_type:complete